MAPYSPFNPLAINLRQQTQHLASIIPPGTPCISELQDASSTQDFLNVLSRLLANPAYTQIIATLFRPILIELCTRWLDDGSEDGLVALCYLIEVHEELFPILSRLLHQSFLNGPLGVLTESNPPTSIETSRLHRLLLSYFRILQANRQLPTQHQWSLGPLSQLIWAEGVDNGVRLLAIKCYAIQAEMGEVESEKLEQQLLGEVGEAECPLEYGENMDGSKKLVDGWIMEPLEIQRVRKERSELLTERIDFYQRDEGDPTYFMENSDLSPSIENIEGILLLKSSKMRGISPNYIPISTSNAALSKLAHHISLRLPVLLTSSPSAGKALLLHHLAYLLHPETKNQMIALHLADTSLDARALLGSYISSATQPGTFEWKEGVLVRAMREGKWIVLEDVDRGSSEVLGTLKPLVESLRTGKWVGGRASIHVPGRGEVVAHEDFLIFATRSVSRSASNKFPAPTFLAAHKFHEVVLDSPPLEELAIIVSGRFPRLAGNVTKAVINMWDSLNALRTTANSREFGLQDLIKFCRRLESLLPSSYHSMDIDIDQPTLSSVLSNPVLKEDLYLEARDVFFGSGTMTVSSMAAAEHVANLIGTNLGLDADRCHWLLNRRTPDLQIETDANGSTTGLRISRTYLPSHKAQGTPFSSTSRPFALHRPAVCLLSRIATAVSLAEPILLTGETGTGKTSVITYLAIILRRPLISLNLSHQTESSDLIGGLKPVDARIPGSILQERFVELFGTTFSRKKNEKFETSIRKAVNEGKWKRVVGLWKESVRMAQERFEAAKQKQDVTSQDVDVDRASEATLPRKRRKLDEGREARERGWVVFLKDVEEFEVQHVQSKGKFTFGFVEGPLIKALRSGDWILLDEINLASPETLECIASLLHGPTASITLTEHGELEPVPRHPNFRLFACMNPATDVGKKDLPPNIRTKFTEIDVSPPDADKETLLSIIEKYIGSHTIGDKGAIMNIAEFYLAIKDLAERGLLADGANHRPHFSMRTLAQALTFAADIASTYSLRRAIWEGCLMAFTMVLDAQSAELVTALAHKHLLAGVRNPRSMLAREPNPPSDTDEYIKFGPFYLAKGPLPQDPMEHYIMTPSVEAKLKDLARIILTRRFPVLIEGPTSSGKTSSIEYLAKRTGHEFIRINNHEHTDIQEYIGSYVSDPVTGKLVFQDGLLVQALRKGSWIVLDELNLAPTDVLEALNRLLDDNRELLIPETQEVVRPHPHFMLFATQNPPGLYAGRKILSRAFRNRFLEVHFEDVPQAELEVILCQRCRIAPSYGKKIVEVFRQLQKRRQSSRVFESKQGFVTLRDLFRWAGRDALGYQELAENGYMLLAERTRRDEDKVAVKEVLEAVMNVRIDEDSLYDLQRYEADIASFLGCPLPPTTNIIWTKAMQRLFVLVSRALKFNEPVLMVGETGSGKTSVCQMFADAVGRKLHGLNCHQNTETADIIGGLRPLRNRQALAAESVQEAASALRQLGLLQSDDHEYQSIRRLLEKALKAPELDAGSRSLLEGVRSKLSRSQAIFEWCDGPLIEAMRNGEILLLDEISLAEDSVLERLNSVLEPDRTIVLAERGGAGEESPVIQADEGFRLVATMNPGGDYGKKELSPALRNRFTEIWVPPVDDRVDLQLIVDSLWKATDLRGFTTPLLDFIDWLSARIGDRSILTLRDILAWITFINCMHHSPQCLLPPDEVFHHAAHMTYLDGLSSLPQLSGYSKESILAITSEAAEKLQTLVPLKTQTASQLNLSNEYVQLGPFSLKVGNQELKPHLFTLSAPTTQSNAVRLARACQVPKPILLEGSPGVGKTSLVVALANMTGQQLHRINLSDQTDLVDLFGSDLPVEGGRPGEFAWRDGEFLQALQLGHWVLLDEMNLAPQAVLEGLNAVLDHRGSVFIPELGRSFTCHPSFRIFAAQNPLNQGGGRKGLPKSFVNRFTKVYIEELTADDYLLVCRHLFPDIDDEVLQAMIAFNTDLNQEVVVKKTFARDGFPWEFNLRDVIRWGSLMMAQGHRQPTAYISTVYLQRFRTLKDRLLAKDLSRSAFPNSAIAVHAPTLTLTPALLELGHLALPRKNFASSKRCGRILKKNLTTLESLGDCISQSWLAIVVGGRNSGKTELIRSVANLVGNDVHEIAVNSATDTMDILGSFEQVDMRTRVAELSDQISLLLRDFVRTSDGSRASSIIRNLHHRLQLILNAQETGSLPIQLRQIEALLLELKSFQVISPQSFAPLQSRLEGLLSSENSTGHFEWIDGPLVKALKSGQWILLDGANLCNPSVLDRLNSLCENNGKLVLSERGFVDGNVEVITPHKNFRLFMTMDPQYGELSRAMRNRGIEITLADNSGEGDLTALQDYLRLPAVAHFTSSDFQMATAEFDAVRRGQMLWEERACSEPSSALGVIQCSSRCPGLLNQITSFAFSRPFSQEAIVPFIIRSTVPNLLSLIRRYNTFAKANFSSVIPSWDRMMDVLSNSEFQAGLRTVHNLANTDRPASLDNMLAKPLDVYLLSNGQESSDEQDISIHHSTLLSYLDLIASSLFSSADVISFVPINQLPEQYAAIAREVQTISALVQEVATSVIQNFLNNPYTSSTDARNVCLLLSYTTHLRTIAHTTPFDFSKAHATIRWFLDLLAGASSTFSQVSVATMRLHDMISLNKGLGLTKVWESLYLRMPDQLVADLQEFSHLSLCLKDESALEAVRLQVLDTMSIAFLQPEVVSTIEYKELRSKLDSYFSSAVDTIEAQAPARAQSFEPTTLAIELSLLSHLNPEKSAKNMQRFIHSACGDKEISLPHLVPYQRLNWMVEHKSGDVKASVLANINWLESTWKLKASEAVPAVCGPGFLNKPVYLLGALQACSTKDTPLSQLKIYEKRIDLQIQRMYLECDDQRSRPEMLEAFFSKNLDLIVSCFDDAENSTPLHQSQLAGADLEKKVQTLLRSSNAYFRESIAQFIQPLCSVDQPHSSGHAWFALGRLLLTLSVPDIPIDPVSIRNSNYNRLTKEKDCLDAQLSLHQQLELLQTGDNTNELIRYLRSQLALIRDKLGRTPHLPDREDTSRLHQFWNEVNQFMDMVLSSTKIEAIIGKLRSGDGNLNPEEEVLQESLSSFYQRLDSLYDDFSDLVIIIKLAIQYFRFGLRLLVSSLSTRKTSYDSSGQLMSAVVAFPTVNSASGILKGAKTLDTLGAEAFRGILLCTSAIATQVNSGVKPGDWILVLDELYQQARGLWSIDRAKDRDAVAAASSLYRKSNLDYSAMTDGEIEEHEFLELFPNFENVMEETALLPDRARAEASAFAPEDQVATLSEIHLLLLLPANGAVASDVIFDKVRKQSVESLLDSTATPATDVLDHDSLPFRFALLHDKLRSVGNSSPKSSQRPNFYLDSNISEVSKVVPTLTKLLSRLEALHSEWPDQEVLRNLIDLCKKVLDINCHSPVAKVLSAIEQLLLRTEDWEIYSNRENTLRLHHDALVTQIVEWRRLELSSWQVLLEAEEIHCRRNGAKWWFQLYDATIRGVLGAVAEEEGGHNSSITVYLRDLVTLLADFMTSSSLGEFEHRMELLASFSMYSAHLMTAKHAKEQDALRRVHTILASTQQYFDQFSTKISTRLVAERTTLEKEIKKFIKLASWKDINVLALKQSAQRSHHQLYKIVRKFRDVLRAPVSAQILPEFVATPQQIASPYDPAHSGTCLDVASIRPPDDMPSSIIGHLAGLQKTFTKFESLVHSKIRPMLSDLSFHRVEGLAIEIVSSCQRLSSIPIPTSLPKERRAKFIKSIQSQKRKAWSDLLKEMKTAGFNHHVKPELLRENTDPLWIKQQPLFPRAEQNDVVKKLNHYFCRLQSCLPALRISSSSHNDDISSRDLTKGVAVVEQLFNIGVGLRASLAQSLSDESQLSSVDRRMKNLDLSKLIFHDPGLSQYLSLSSAFLSQSSKMLSELISSIRIFHLPKALGNSLHDTLRELDQRLVENDGIREQVTHISGDIDSCFLALREEEQHTLLSIPAFTSSLSEDLLRWAEIYPRLSHLFLPSHRWFVAGSSGLSTLPTPLLDTSRSTPDESFQRLINALLVTVQSATSLCDRRTEEHEENDEDDRYISRLIDAVRRSNQILNLGAIRLQVTDMLSNIQDVETASKFIPRVLPFLQVYLRLAEDQLNVQAHCIKSLFKLNYVLCSVVQTLATKGFCKPPDETGDGGGEEGVENASGGVGLGEGSGTENVSKEIEDESQVEGLQGDDSEDQPREKNKDEKEDALEMTEDFGGELEDVPDNDDSGSDSGSDNSSDIDPEERMEDLDPLDANAVDEKLWGDDDSGPDEKDGGDKSNKDDGKTQEEGKSEMVAKEGEDSRSAKKKEKEPDASEQPLDQDENGDSEQQQAEPDMEESSEPNVNGAPMDEHLPDGDVLDLPDDMDLGDEEVRDDVDMEDLGDDLVDMEAEQMPQPDDFKDSDGSVEEEQVGGEDNTPEDESGALGENEQPDVTAETGEEDHPGENEENEVIGKADISNGDDGVEEDMGEGDVDQSAASGQTGASRRGGDRGAESAEKALNDQGSTDNQELQTDDTQRSEDEIKGEAVSDGQEGGNPAETEFKQTPNPLRSIGDALKEIQQRFDDIMHQDSEHAETKSGDVDNKSRQLEYLRPDDEDVDMQALGPAEQHDAARLNELKMADSEEGVDAPMDLDIDINEAPAEMSPHEHPSAFDQLKSHSQELDVEGAILQQASKQNELKHLPNDAYPKAEAEQAELGQAIEAELRNWKVADYASDGAERLWRLYESLTHDLAYALCEQLRLILEPTLATRLKGDYRTGKRLNMKKVISYIASDYTKDKIWLRRTKPSQREYQVLIAIDDSRSMAESHSIHLAYETLALLGKALNRLESGDISVVKFGEAVDVVHGFDDGPLTDQAGAKVIDAFRFDQKATNVLSLLETSLSVLDIARERRTAGSSSASDLWQLEIIISDGMCQDHEKLRTMLRRAEEKRVMVVFIILDSLHTTPKANEASSATDVGRRSILHMDKAEFKNVDGRMELQLQKYLDSFPFEYYVVLRDVEALPGVLSSTLKQFFERISEQ